MRRAALAFAAFAALASFASPELLLMPPRFGDPTRMQVCDSSRSTTVATLYIEREGVSNITFLAWMKWDPNGRAMWTQPFVLCEVSPDSARATTEGGPTLSNCCAHAYSTPLPLANGTWSETCLPSGYEVPANLADTDWQYGCYCVNVETDSDLTLTVAGAERSVVASNGVMQTFTMRGETSSRAVAISAANAGATVRFGIAESPLCQFVGGQSGLSAGGGGEFLGYSDDTKGGLSSNEWRMVVFRAAVTNGIIATETSVRNALGPLAPADVSNAACFRPHPHGFERNARFRIMVACAQGIGGISRSGLDENAEYWAAQPVEHFLVYGLKGYCSWLTDTEIERIFDVDAAELQRRGL